jgi:hypothetical protein
VETGNFLEKRIGGEKQIDPDRSTVARAEPIVLFPQDKSWKSRVVFDSDDEINIPRISALDELQDGESADKHMGDLFLFQSRDKLPRVFDQQFFVHDRTIVIEHRVPKYQRQIIATDHRGSGRR